MTEEEIKEIADYIDSGMVCYIHIKTKKIIIIPDSEQAMYADMDEYSEELEAVENNIEDYFAVEKMDSHESFKVMEAFANTVTDPKVKDRLHKALSRHKPFHNFKYEIDDSGEYRQLWFAFKDQQKFEWVKSQLVENNL